MTTGVQRVQRLGWAELPLPWPVESMGVGRFLERPNRFIGVVEYEGEVIRGHIADPGRLRELLVPGAEVSVRHDPGPGRKMAYSIDMVRSPETGVWVSINSQVPNKVVGALLKRHLAGEIEIPGLPPVGKGWALRREVQVGESRFDFQLTPTSGGKPWILEIKGASLVVEGVAMFPDAPSVRGARHVNELAHLQEAGDYETGVIFMVQRPDAEVFTPFQERDPEFAQAVRGAVQAGTQVVVLGMTLSMAGYGDFYEIPLRLP